jgi:hypothetical protein
MVIIIWLEITAPLVRAVQFCFSKAAADVLM